MRIYNIAIIGAGASGLMFASLLRKKKDSCIIEKNSKIGAKIEVSGGGRCNISNKNISVSNYLGDKNFLKPILKDFKSDDLLSFCKERDVFPEVDEKSIKGSYFCKSSKDVIEMFKKGLRGVEQMFDTEVQKIEYIESESIFYIETSSGIIKSRKIIVASGSLSFPNLGASKIAFDIAESFNHSIETLSPALVGFTVQPEEFWFKNISGLSMRVRAKVENKSLESNILFTHKGCSGPLILNSSLYWKNGKISLDFLPKNSLKKLLIGNERLSAVLPLPKKFISEFLKVISVKDKTVDKLSQNEISKLEILKDYQFSPAGNFGYSKAEVTKGGINTSEINSKTMESNLQKSLYFIGESLNITGELGGYNFHFAFSSASKCATEINL